MLEDNINEVRKARHKESQEDFTPTDITALLVEGSEDMMADFSKTIIDISSGVCYILVECIKHRIAYCSNENDVIRAVSTIYGTELHQDNVDEGIQNMKNAIENECGKKGIELSGETMDAINKILQRNIACTDTFKWNYSQWKPFARSNNTKLF